MPNPESVALPNPSQITFSDEAADDALTGLHWQRDHTPKMTWVEALAHCEDLVLAGRDDWWLPTRIELISIVDFTRRPTIDGRAFPDTAEDYFWSASSVGFDDALAFSVYFGAGLTAMGNKTIAGGHVRCVRGGRPGVLPRYRLTAMQVTDLNTGLVWQRNLLSTALTWDTARTYCDDLDLGGAADWRLPSTKELQTLVDEDFDHPVTDPSVFPDGVDARFWTGSASNQSNDGIVVYVDFADGTSEETNKSDELRVRCVR